MSVARFLSIEGFVRSAVNEALASTDTPMTFATWRVLHLVRQRPDGGLAALAFDLGVHKQAVSRDVAKLCEQGLLTVETHEDDGRRRVYQVSEDAARADDAVSARVVWALRRKGIALDEEAA